MNNINTERMKIKNLSFRSDVAIEQCHKAVSCILSQFELRRIVADMVD